MSLKDKPVTPSTFAIFYLVLSLIISSCEKPERIVKLSTLEVSSTDISYTSAVLKGEIIDLGSKPISKNGFVISESGTPTLGISREVTLEQVSSKGIFNYSINDLSKNTTYYFRAYLIVNKEEKYGDTKTFKTRDTEPPVVTAGTVTVLDQTSASVNCEVTSDGGEATVVRGLCWDWENPNPTIASCKDSSVNGSGKGVFTGTMTGLTPRTRYYVRAYAINSKGISYNSSDIIVKTFAVPQVTTTAISGISNTGAVSGGEVTDDGQTEVTARGVCWGTSANPTIELPTKTNDGTGKGVFSSTISGLVPLTTYYVRAYATNRFGTNYGDSKSFITTKQAEATTNPATSVLSTSAILNGTVNANSYSTIVSFEYGTTTSYGSTITATPSPVTGTTSTAVSAALTGLTENTTYHFRLKTSNAGGISYGTDQSFTTLQPPTATTNNATSVSSSGAILNGTINANASSSTVSFEYGTTASYGSSVTANEILVTGNSPIGVTANITGLLPFTTYHYRVKAVSAGGTSTGDDAFFTTAANVADIDGNFYSVISIGTQTWMQENLKVTHFSNGDPIPEVTDGFYWMGLASSAMCWYNNDVNYKNIYGGLYNSYATTDVRNVCPVGWHSADDQEWTILTDFLGGAAVAGGALKETGLDHWADPNTGATNSSAFTMVPGGWRGTISGVFTNIGQAASFCVAQWHTGYSTVTRDIYYNDINVATYGAGTVGRSVRCIKGELPLTETNSVSLLSSTTASLIGKVNPNGASTNVTFEYGPTTSYGSEASAIQSPVSGIISSDVSASLTGLTPGTLYHYRLKAVNSGGTAYGGDATFTCPDLLTDYEGNIYNTIQIGTQIWMQENLRSTKYNDGSSITYYPVDVDWRYISDPAYCWTGNDIANKPILGALYNWHVAGTGKICPTGWHVPTETEYTSLTSYLGGLSLSGGKLKSLSGWSSPNTGATNESGFDAKSGGMRDKDGAFVLSGTHGTFWSNTQYEPDLSQSYYLYLLYNSSAATITTYYKSAGANIRCLKD